MEVAKHAFPLPPLPPRATGSTHPDSVKSKRISQRRSSTPSVASVMYLKRLSNISKTIGFRLTVLYLGIFVLSALLLFVILYFFLSAALSKHDRDMVLSELEELSVEYKTAGITSLETRLTANRKLQKQHSLFIRVADAKNNTFRLYLPYQWNYNQSRNGLYLVR